jgi:hypothetical protein
MPPVRIRQMRRGVFTVGLILGAGVVVGGAAVYAAGIALAWAAAILWLNPWLCIVLAVGLLFAVLLSRGKTHVSKITARSRRWDDL